MQLLDDLYNETRRLFIAGSRLSKADPRLKKFIPGLEKLGEKAPVMKRLAEKYTALAESGSPDALAEAGTLLYAVMATQGVAEIPGTPVETAAMIYSLPETKVPYSRLKPVVEALTLSKQGRLEILTTAHKDGLLRDFRLYGLLVGGLDDKYAAIGEFLFGTVIPELGEPLIPFLLESYNREGKTGDAYRLVLLARMGYKDAESMALDAVENGSATVAVAGIQLLGTFPKNEEYLIKLTGDKKSAIRKAALTGLSAMKSEQGIKIIMDFLKGARFADAVDAAQLCGDPDFAAELLELLKERYTRLLAPDFSFPGVKRMEPPGEALTQKEFKSAHDKLSELIMALSNKFTPEIMEFYRIILKDRAYTNKCKENGILPYSRNVRDQVCILLSGGPAEMALPVCEDAMDKELAKNHHWLLCSYFRMASRAYTKDRLFSAFSPYYDEGLLYFQEMFLTDERQLEQIIRENGLRAVRAFALARMDARWIGIFAKREDMMAVGVLLTEDAPYAKEMKVAVFRRLSRVMESGRPDFQTGRAVGAYVESTPKKSGFIFRSETEKLAEIVFTLFEKVDGYYARELYNGIGSDNIIKLFYPDYGQRFEELSSKKTAVIFKDISALMAAK